METPFTKNEELNLQRLILTIQINFENPGKRNKERALSRQRQTKNLSKFTGYRKQTLLFWPGIFSWSPAFRN